MATNRRLWIAVFVAMAILVGLGWAIGSMQGGSPAGPETIESRMQSMVMVPLG